MRPLSLELGVMGAGAGEHGPAQCGHWHLPTPDTYAKFQKWGFNSVELMVTWANLEPVPPTRVDGRMVHHWNQPYLRALDEVIAHFHAHGIAVVLMMLQSRWSGAFRNLAFPNGDPQRCGEGMPAWLYRGWGTGYRAMVKAELEFFHNKRHVQAGFASAWAMLAHRYVDDPAVIGGVILFEAYDLLATPYPGTENLTPEDLNLAGFYTRVGRAIHRANPHLIQIFVDFASYGNKAFALTRRPAVPNAVYSFEFYSHDWIPHGRARFDAYAGRANSWGMPAWIGEFSAFDYTRSPDPSVTVDPHWKNDTRALLAYAKARHVGWSLAAYWTTFTPDFLRILRNGF